MKKLATLALITTLTLAVAPVDAGSRRHNRSRHHRHHRSGHRGSWLRVPVPSPGEVLLGALILGAILDEPDRPVPPHYGRVDCDVHPEEAHVYVNGEYMGTADDLDGHPSFLYLPAGRYRLTFRLEGYRTWDKVVRVSPGRELPMELQLRPLAPGEAEPEEPGWAEVPDDPGGRRGGPLDWEE